MDHSIDLLASISDKLQQSNKNMIQEKNYQRVVTDSQIVQIQKSLARKRKNQEQQILTTKSYLQKISSLSNQTIKAYSLKQNKERQIVQNMKQQIENQIEAKDKQHQNNLEEITDKIEQKMNKWMIECEKKARDALQKIENRVSDLSKKVIKIEKQIKVQTQIRIENCHKITSFVQQQVLRFKDKVQFQRQKNSISQRKIYQMIEQINTKMNKQLETQCNKRKKNNQSLLKLIQLACDKLEHIQIKAD